MKLWIGVLLSNFLLISCANSNTRPIPLPPEQIIVTKTVKQLPPEHYVHDCISENSDESVLAEIVRLNDLVKCERRDKAAIRAWMNLSDQHRADPAVKSRPE